MKLIVLAAASLFVLGGAAQAQRVSNISGGKLGDICISKSSAQLEACNAYLEGVSDMISFYQNLLPKDGSKGGKLPEYVCVPGPTTGPQLREAYVSWLRKHAEAQRQPAVQAAARALNDSYMCPGEGK